MSNILKLFCQGKSGHHTSHSIQQTGSLQHREGNNDSSKRNEIMTSVDDFQLRTVIKFCHSFGYKPTKTFTEVENSKQFNCSISLAFKRHERLRKGRDSVEDDDRSVWKTAASPPPKKTRVMKSGGKHIFFMNRRGMLLIHQVPDGQTINATYYQKEKDATAVKLHHDNKPAGPVNAAVILLTARIWPLWTFASSRK
ncbi:hypothetical protein DPMN_111701 [Dreissena polymorpha]|uniref:Uncharacterized protein n=1 Tax=Dreissena polymorpha TaxID=45954 RepID=A0A9D4KF02_DREPO|nr:hypothetical protein DPMN_111701 [Dreissena polymorpha]